MKKIIAVMLAIITVFVLSACSTATAVTYSAAWGRTNVKEVSTYKVTVVANESENSVGAPRLNGEGTYTSTITGGNDEGYTVTSVMDFNGNYVLADGSSVPVSDHIETKVEFGNAGQSFKPKSSYRNYDGTTIEYNTQTSSFNVVPLKYSSLITYGEKASAISLSSENGVADLPSSFEINNPKTVYFDNEQLMYVIRGMMNDTIFDKGMSTTFSLISGLSKESVVMSAAVTKGETVDVSTNIDGVSATMDAFRVYLYRSGENSGTPIYMYFAKDDMGEVNSGVNKTKVSRSRLIRMEQNVAYSNDTLLYELTSYDYQ